MGKRLDPNVRALGFVSLVNDIGSEMIYPLLPSFLVGVLGASAQTLGIIEGTAEASASFLKYFFGALSDRARSRKPFILVGYFLSALSRPLLGMASSSLGIGLLRLLDRGGKGVRTAPRDALLSQVTDPGDRGWAFGFQRAMDNVGAVIGPLVAASALSLHLPTREVFLLATVPGVFVVLAVLVLVRDTSPEAAGGNRSAGPPAPGPLPQGFFAYLGVLAVFTLGNSSDAFLLLRARESGVSLAMVPVLWSFHSLVKAALSAPLGALSDRMGRKPSIGGGWALYALTYALFALGSVPLPILFGLYALHYSFTEAPERALVSDLTHESKGGRAFGLYHGVTGAMLLPASLLTGWLWTAHGAPVALLTGAGLAGLAALGLMLFVPTRAPGDAPPKPL